MLKLVARLNDEYGASNHYLQSLYFISGQEERLCNFFDASAAMEWALSSGESSTNTAYIDGNQGRTGDYLVHGVLVSRDEDII